MASLEPRGLGVARADERAEAFLSEFRAMARRGNAPQLIWEAIQNAMKAQTTVRAPNPDSPRGWSYDWTDDHGIRLAAARLGADLLGMIPKAGVSVSMQDNRVQISVSEQIAEFVSVGGDPGQLMAEMQSVLEGAKAAGIKPAIQAEATPTDAKPIGSGMARSKTNVS